RKSNAGLVSLTMTCFSYLVFMSTEPQKVTRIFSKGFRNSKQLEILASLLLRFSVLRDFVVYSRPRLLPEVSFLVARLQYASILHHHAQLPCEAKRQQQPLQRRRQHFCRLHLPTKLAEVLLFVEVIYWIRHLFRPWSALASNLPRSYSCEFFQSRLD